MFAMSLGTVAAQSTVTLAWDPSPDAGVGGYYIYYKTVAAPSFATTNVIGQATTNVTIQGIVVNTVYQFYATAYSTNGLESDTSNQVRYQYFQVNGSGKPTALTLGDVGTSNFAGFLLVSAPTNGLVSGNPPNVIFSPNGSFTGKDAFSYRNPELFAGVNITNTYAVYKVGINTPPRIKSLTPN